MKLKAIEILNIHEALQKLSGQELDLEVSYNIAKNIKELSVSKGLIEGKRNKTIEKYAERQEDGNLKQTENGDIKITNMVEFSCEIEKLLNSEIEIPLTSIPKKDLCGISIPPKTLLPLIGTLLEE